MASFPTLGAQQETNRKILEDIQLKKQQLQKGVSPVPSTISGVNAGGLTPTQANQLPASQLVGQSTELAQTSGAAASRSAFNPSSSTTLGFFIPQDSYYGNSFIPVLPRLEPLPQSHSTTK